MIGRRTKAISKDADYALDLYFGFTLTRGEGECSNSRSRRFRDFSSRGDILNDDRFEEDYVAFILDLEEFAELEFVKDDVEDPDYVMFLDNLKERGNSYVLDKSIKHGIYSPIMYEVDDIYSDGEGCDEYAQKKRNLADMMNGRNGRSCEFNGTRPRGESMKRKGRCYFEDSSEYATSDFNISGSSKRKIKSIDQVIREKRVVYEVVKKRKLRSGTKNHVQEKGSGNVNDCPENFVASKLKPYPVSSDYSQEEEGEEEELRTKTKKPFGLGSDYSQEEPFAHVSNDSKSAPKTPSLEKKVPDKVYKLFMDNFKPYGESCVYEYGDKKLIYYDSPGDRHPVSVAATSSDHLPSNWRHSIAANSSKQPITATTTLSSDHLQNDDCCLAINALPISVVPPSNVQAMREIVYGLSSQAPSRKRKTRPLPLTVQAAPQSQPTQPSTSGVPAQKQTIIIPFDKQLDNRLQVCHRVPFVMRKKLEKILSQPYSKEEHEQLWKEVSFCSPVLIHRDSRSGGSDRPGQMGRSLLDWNPDVQSEIEKVKSDPHKVLNLLRMLSFYLKKLPCGRICKPWMDDTLMAIFPRSS